MCAFRERAIIRKAEKLCVEPQIEFIVLPFPFGEREHHAHQMGTAIGSCMGLWGLFLGFGWDGGWLKSVRLSLMRFRFFAGGHVGRVFFRRGEILLGGC